MCRNGSNGSNENHCLQLLQEISNYSGFPSNTTKITSCIPSSLGSTTGDFPFITCYCYQLLRQHLHVPSCELSSYGISVLVRYQHCPYTVSALRYPHQPAAQVPVRAAQQNRDTASYCNYFNFPLLPNTSLNNRK